MVQDAEPEMSEPEVEPQTGTKSEAEAPGRLIAGPFGDVEAIAAALKR